MTWTLLGLALAAGHNPYATLLLLAVFARSPRMTLDLQAPWDTLTHTWVMAVLFVFAGVQVVLDKHPRTIFLEERVNAVVGPLAAFAAVAGLVGLGGTTSWLLAIVVVPLAILLHWLRSRTRARLTSSMAGLGHVLFGLVTDGTMLMVALLALLLPVIGAVTAGISLAALLLFALRVAR